MELHQQHQRSCHSLRELPEDVLFLLCSHLDAQALVRLSATCSWLYQELCSAPVWRPRCMAHGVTSLDGWPPDVTHRTLYLNLLRLHGNKLGIWAGEVSRLQQGLASCIPAMESVM